MYIIIYHSNKLPRLEVFVNSSINGLVTIIIKITKSVTIILRINDALNIFCSSGINAEKRIWLLLTKPCRVVSNRVINNMYKDHVPKSFLSNKRIRKKKAPNPKITIEDLCKRVNIPDKIQFFDIRKFLNLKINQFYVEIV